VPSRPSTLTLPVALAALVLAGCARNLRPDANEVQLPKLPPLAAVDPISPDALQALAPLYAPTQQANEALIRKGELKEATRRLLAVTPAAGRTALHNLYLGNVLFALDPEESFARHFEALTQQPDSALVNLEAGYEYLRARQPYGACTLLARSLAKTPEQPAVQALRASCLLETGELRAAVEAWREADQPKHHVAIEEAISEVYGLPNPWAEHARLLAAAQASPTEAAVAVLVRHDVTWPLNWWNRVPEVGLGREDLERFAPKLSPQAREALTLVLDSTEGAMGTKDRLRGVLQRGAQLSTPTLRALVEVGLRTKALTAKEVFEWLVSVMESRTAGPAATADDAEFLGALALDNNAALLAQADAECWRRFADRRCAESHFYGLAQAAPLKADDPELRRACALHPDSALLQSFALDLAGADARDEVQRVRRTLVAEFHNLQLGPQALGEHTSYGLKNLFMRLEKALANAKP
jgi:hypothetical protein